LLFAASFFLGGCPHIINQIRIPPPALAERSAPAFCVGESFCDFLPAFFRGLFFSRVAFGPSDILRLGYGPYQVLRRLLERHALPSQWQRTMHGSTISCLLSTFSSGTAKLRHGKAA
jgi:hypothetical protein